jgi:hypothetical protein
MTDSITIGKQGLVFSAYIAWDQIYLFEEKENGTWTVAVFMDDRLLASREFTIQQLPELIPAPEFSDTGWLAAGSFSLGDCVNGWCRFDSVYSLKSISSGGHATDSSFSFEF